MTCWAVLDSNQIVTACGMCRVEATTADFAHIPGTLCFPAPSNVQVGGRIADGAFEPRPDSPSTWHVFDPVAFAWVLPNNYLDEAKDAAKDRINREWKAAEQRPFPAYGKTFDADDKAIQRILGAAQAAAVAKQLGQPMSIEWTCADNSTLIMDADMLVAIPVILAQAADALHQRARALKAQIAAATTLEQIDSVIW